jgi:trimethylamine:corrinoid methyltransferase-like protein
VRWATWLEQGGRSMEEEARAKGEEILASDPPQYLGDDQRRELERLVKVGLEEVAGG